MTCPLCGERRARRRCPALAKDICPVCCGTKRLVEIQCPGDCAYLSTAREHPAAVVVRQQQRDVDLVVHAMRDLNERQSRLFLLLATVLIRYEPPALERVIDEDVAEAAAAVAGTLETAARGVIYEHQPASLPAGRLARALREALAEAGKGATSSFDRDATVVLRRIEEATHDVRARHAENGPSRGPALVDLLARVIRPPQGKDAAEGGRDASPGSAAGEAPGDPAQPSRERSRLIVP